MVYTVDVYLFFIKIPGESHITLLRGIMYVLLFNRNIFQCFFQIIPEFSDRSDIHFFVG